MQADNGQQWKFQAIDLSSGQYDQRLGWADSVAEKGGSRSHYSKLGAHRPNFEFINGALVIQNSKSEYGEEDQARVGAAAGAIGRNVYTISKVGP